VSELAYAPSGRRSIAAERASDALKRGWRAHLLGDRTAALFHLEALRHGMAGLGDRWPLAILGLSLYAFTCASVGEDEKAVQAARKVASLARQHDPRRNTPLAIRVRLASELPAEPMDVRLRETVERWTLAVAYRLPSTQLRLVHECDLNRLRPALQAEAATSDDAGR